MATQICKYMKALCHSKINSAYDGNISFKPKNSNTIYISPGGIPKYSLKKKMINKIKINTFTPNILSDIVKEQYSYKYTDTGLYFDRQYNEYEPSGEIKIHTNIMNSLHTRFHEQDIAIMHCHPKNILAFMGLEKGRYRELADIQTLFPELPNFIHIGSNVAHITARTEELADAIIEKFVDCNFIGLLNHGIVCYAESFDKCLDMITILDYYCECALKYYASL